jgi:hypothetical protein
VEDGRGVEKGTKAQRHRGTEAQRHKGTEAQRHKGTEAQRHRGIKAQKHKGTEAQRHKGTKAVWRFWLSRWPGRRGSVRVYGAGSIRVRGVGGIPGRVGACRGNGQARGVLSRTSAAAGLPDVRCGLIDRAEPDRITTTEHPSGQGTVPGHGERLGERDRRCPVHRGSPGRRPRGPAAQDPRPHTRSHLDAYPHDPPSPRHHLTYRPAAPQEPRALAP